MPKVLECMSQFPPCRQRLRFHYAWVVLICAMVLIVLSAAIRQSFGVFIDPLVTAYGWSRGAVSLAYSLSFISAMAVSLGVGPVSERIGPRRLLLLSVVSFTAGVMLMGTATALWQFYLYFGLLCGGVGYLLNIVIPVAITRWFARSVGVALGLTWAAMGIGGMVGPVALRWLISVVGWQNTFLLAGAGLGGAMLLALYFFRSSPQGMNMPAYGEEAAPGLLRATEFPGGSDPAQGIGLDRLRKSPAFWHLINAHFLGCVGHSILLAHIVALATLEGVPALTAAGILSTLAAASILSRFGFPILTEKLGGRTSLALAFLMQAGPIPLLFLVGSTWQFYVVAAVFGLGFGGEMPSFPIINRQYWGPRSPLNAIYSWQTAGAMMGMALGGWLGGALFDITGTYHWSIAAAFLFTAAGQLPIMSLPRHRLGLSETTAVEVAPVLSS
jgi:MFS family permease